MLSISRDTFLKDLLIWFLLSVILASLFAAGLSEVADNYFSQAVVGLMGDVGEYDLLFQVRTDLQDVAVAQIKKVIKQKLPGSTLKSGVSVAGKTAVFLGLAPRYRTKQIYSDLDFYFQDITGNAGFTIMTEPRLTLSGIPGRVIDLFISEAEEVPGVDFAFRDGGKVAVLLESIRDRERVRKELRRVIEEYQLLEVTFPSGFEVENAVESGRALADLLAGQEGVSYIRDVTSGESASDEQALMLTISEMKRFLLSYAGQVEITPEAGSKLYEGDLLALEGKEGKKPLQEGGVLEAQDVIVKVTSVDEGEDGKKQGLIIQGDAGQISSSVAFLMEEKNKVGRQAAAVVVNSPKDKLDKTLKDSIDLLQRLHGMQDVSVEGDEVFTAARTLQAALGDANRLLSGSGPAGVREIAEFSNLLSGIGGQLQTMADTLARLSYFENKLNKAVAGLEGAQVLTSLGLIPPVQGDLAQRVQLLDGELGRLTEKLRERARILDDFINRFNPLVQALLSWKAKSTQLAKEVDKVQKAMTGEESTGNILAEISGLTAESLGRLEELDLQGLEEEYTTFTAGLEELKSINMAGIVDQLKSMKSSLPKLRDEEIGRTISLLDKYLGGPTNSGSKIRLFVHSGYSKKEVLQTVQKFFGSDRVGLHTLPAAEIESDVRNELTRLLQEVKGVIAAITVIILGVLFFLLDQTPVMAVFHYLDLVAPYPSGGQPGDGHKIWSKLGLSDRLQRKVFPWVYALLLGSLWSWLTFRFSGAHIPYLNDLYFLPIGGLLGLFFLVTANRFHQLNLDEVIAGTSLGLSFTVIMREIVIPAGRPGLLQLLNRRKMVMK